MLNGIGPASLFILGVNIALGLLAMGNPRIMERCVFRPYEFARGLRRGTIVASGFAHADLPHLAFNMITFWFFGVPLERTIGTTMFVLLYVIGLLLSQLQSYRKHRNDPEYGTLGASGAVSAVLFAMIVYYPTMSLYMFFIPIPIPAPLFGVAYIAYSWWSGKQNRGRINHDAHLGGALAGLAFVAVTDWPAFLRAIHLIFG